jgi:hypothetical protein
MTVKRQLTDQRHTVRILRANKPGFSRDSKMIDRLGGEMSKLLRRSKPEARTEHYSKGSSGLTAAIWTSSRLCVSGEAGEAASSEQPMDIWRAENAVVEMEGRLKLISPHRETGQPKQI